jgi:hypothetical protein
MYHCKSSSHIWLKGATELGSWAVHIKATYLHIRIYLWGVIGMILLGRLADLIVSLSTKSMGGNRLSDGNMLLLILLCTAIVLPIRYFKRIIHLGASREQYFKGLHLSFALWATGIALFNTCWYIFEVKVLRQYTGIVDMIEAFHWNDFGFAGIFLYQTAFYIMAMAFLSMLVSGYHHPAGWLLSALVITAIPVGTAFSSLRVHVASFFKALLFNSSLPAGIAYNLALYLLFVAGAWLFTRRRTH